MYQERDPIERVRKLILAHDLATAQELKVCIVTRKKGI
jgi:TPP-dependent pyruvate/acetoin dehydrogenase alpha subunit